MNAQAPVPRIVETEPDTHRHWSMPKVQTEPPPTRMLGPLAASVAVDLAVGQASRFDLLTWTPPAPPLVAVLE